MRQTSLAPHQEQFLKLLLATQALKFGEFTLKSGRLSPYFVNLGSVTASGDGLNALGEAYAGLISNAQLNPDVIFGPAYKGIPLAAVTGAALARHGRNVAVSSNRKEAKDHGDAGMFLGATPVPGQRVVIVEDVITAGTTLREVVPVLRERGALVRDVVIAVDRCEKGQGTKRASVEAADEHQLTVHSILSVHDILGALSKPNNLGRQLSDAEQDAIRRYLAQYGA